MENLATKQDDGNIELLIKTLKEKVTDVLGGDKNCNLNHQQSSSWSEVAGQKTLSVSLSTVKNVDQVKSEASCKILISFAQDGKKATIENCTDNFRPVLQEILTQYEQNIADFAPKTGPKPPQDLAEFATQAMDAYLKCCDDYFSHKGKFPYRSHVKSSYKTHSIQMKTSIRDNELTKEQIFLSCRHQMFNIYIPWRGWINAHFGVHIINHTPNAKTWDEQKVGIILFCKRKSVANLFCKAVQPLAQKMLKRSNIGLIQKSCPKDIKRYLQNWF